MKRKISKRKVKSSTIYMTVIFSLLGLYIIIYSLSFFNDTADQKTATQLYKKQSLNSYSFYLVDKEYNPDTETLIAKLFFRKEKTNDVYIPITKEFFSAKAQMKSDETAKIKTNLMMPTKNFIVIAMEGVKPDAEVTKLDLNMKTDIVSQDKDNKGTNLGMYLDIPKRIYNKELKVKSESEYIIDANKEEIVFLDKDIDKKIKKDEQLKKEISIAEDQIQVIKDDMETMSSSEKDKAEYTIKDFELKIEENKSKLEENKLILAKLQEQKENLKNGVRNG